MQTVEYRFGDTPTSLTNGAGDIRDYASTEDLIACVEQSKADWMLICREPLTAIASAQYPNIRLDHRDVVHAGLLFGANRCFNTLHYASMKWFFLDAAPDKCCTNWKATPDLCWLRPEQVRAIGGFDRAYSTATVMLMDVGYRLTIAGSRVVFDPHCYRGQTQIEQDIPPSSVAVDEYVFILRHLGVFWTLYTAFWHSLTTRNLQVWQYLMLARRRVKQFSAPPAAGQMKTRLNSESKTCEITSVSAIIPTLNRYGYLAQAITSLQEQEPPPAEIIVVDQTPVEQRVLNFYEQFGDSVRVVFLDKPGQATARNAGVELARTSWCLLFDDDSVAWKGMLSEHLRLLETTGADASTGLSLAPWKNEGYIPKSLRHAQVADVLDTGNALISRQAILSVGAFDPAFDHGSGADHDLGTRLYLAGYEIILSPLSIRTHYKAKTGGLRIYGAWWREKTASWRPFPPATQIYTIQKYYHPRYWWSLYLTFFVRAKRRHSLPELIRLYLTAPIVLLRALRAAHVLKRETVGNVT